MDPNINKSWKPPLHAHRVLAERGNVYRSSVRTPPEAYLGLIGAFVRLVAGLSTSVALHCRVRKLVIKVSAW